MTGRRRPPKGMSDEDRALWSAYAKSVRPLNEEPRPVHPRPKKSAEPPAGSPAGPVPKPVTAKAPRPESGLDHKLRRKVRRGHVSIDATIDLHGMRQSEAEAALIRFLRSSSAAGRGLVLVITGKGRSSDADGHWWESREKGVLRRLVPEILHRRDIAPLVVGFEAAAVPHGGEGAYYIRLRRKT
ncbi:MAG: Smr/MutS family protein [Rhodobiaceae bacterium]|nr:Smr/MutS family protein [Rhodobiaceae bacterium]